jgi:phage/plasmid-like protein (TIGR03299 family)
MSHDIEVFRSGQAAFFSARQPAWHRLGTVTTNALSAEEALETALLGNWNVMKRPVFTTSPTGEPIPIKGKYATVRRNPSPGSTDSDALGIVGEDYEVIQNEEAFSFLTGLADHGDAVFETAGSLRGGARVFVTMRIPEPMKIADNDELDLYVAVATGHDGSFAFSAFPTPVRVVCQNTLSLALSGNKRVHKVRHATGAAPKLVEARAMLALTITEGDPARSQENAWHQDFQSVLRRHHRN